MFITGTPHYMHYATLYLDVEISAHIYLDVERINDLPVLYLGMEPNIGTERHTGTKPKGYGTERVREMRQITVNGMTIRESMTFEDVVERLASVFPTDEIELVNFYPETVVESGTVLPALRDLRESAYSANSPEAREVFAYHAGILFRSRHNFGE